MRRPPAARRRGLVIAAAVLLPLVLLVVVYLVFFTPSSPDRLQVSTRGEAGSSPAPLAGEVDGTWRPGPDSVVGYRVRERLARLPASSDAVGRTNAVTGSVTLRRQGETVVATDANFTADVSTLRSDEPRRDNRIRTMGLETEQFPSATFRSSSPIAVPASALSGQVARVDATGDLTIHGVTKRVTIPLDVKASGAQVEVAGSLTFPFADFGMEAPNVGGIVTVESNPTLEVKLILLRA